MAFDELATSYARQRQRLGMWMSELFTEMESQPTITARRSIARVDMAMPVLTPQYEYYYLCADLRRKRMIPILGIARARNLEEFGPLIRHAGEEFVYVVEGQMELHTEFYEPIVLKPGEGAYIDSNMGHAYLVAPGFTEAKILGVCVGNEEELMPAAMAQHLTENGAAAQGAEAIADVPAPKTKPSRRRPATRGSIKKNKH